MYRGNSSFRALSVTRETIEQSCWGGGKWVIEPEARPSTTKANRLLARALSLGKF
jgi:hypothetical protein